MPIFAFNEGLQPGMNSSEISPSWPDRWKQLPLTRRRLTTVIALFYAAFVLILVSISGPGLAWDEPFYLTAGYQFYLKWFSRIGTDAFTRKAIQECWSAVQWHPPLGQLLIGVMRLLAEDWLGPLVAGRLAGALFFSGLVAGLYLFAARHYGELAGVCASLCLLCMPRLFGHAHFTALDLPAAATWFAATAVFVEGVDRNARWWAAAGAVLGLAWLTKTTCFPLPLLFVSWAVWSRGKKALGPCLGLAAAIPVFFLWPLMWIQPWEQFKTFFGTVSARPSINLLYFGRVYDCFDTPWHYPLVMILGTLPVCITAVAVLGSWISLRNWREDRLCVLVFANIAFLLFVTSLPGIAKYDGVRLFLPMFPFIAVFAGIGLSRTFEKWIAAGKPGTFVKSVLALFFAYHLVWLYALQPFYLSDYSLLFGGLPGAERAGMETTYWEEAIDKDVIGFVNENAPTDARVALFPYPELAKRFHEDMGTFREDIVLVDPREDGTWTIEILVCRRGMFDHAARRLYENERPLFERKLMGVPLCQVYGRRSP